MKPTYLTFKKTTYTWKSTINYREKPHLYKVGRGEQGVLICEPYKSELLPNWRFKTPEIALKSSKLILAQFKHYLLHNDFVGADLARKYLQMGFTRARRYANYKGGLKYNKMNDYEILEKNTGDPSKALSAKIFYDAWQKAENNKKYAKLKLDWKNKFG